MAAGPTRHLVAGPELGAIHSGAGGAGTAARPGPGGPRPPPSTGPARTLRTGRGGKRRGKAREGAAFHFSVKTKTAEWFQVWSSQHSSLFLPQTPPEFPWAGGRRPGPSFLISLSPFCIVSFPNPNFKVARKGACKARRPSRAEDGAHRPCRTRSLCSRGPARPAWRPRPRAPPRGRPAGARTWTPDPGPKPQSWTKNPCPGPWTPDPRSGPWPRPRPADLDPRPPIRTWPWTAALDPEPRPPPGA